MSKSACGDVQRRSTWSSSPAAVGAVLERAVAPVDEQGGAPRSASSDVVKRSGRPSPVKSSKTLPPAMFGPRRVEAGLGRDVLEPADVEPSSGTASIGIRYAGGHLVGVLAQGHVGEVQEPADAEVAGPLVEVRR